MSPDVSVVIPTRRRPALLAACLDALSRQSLGRGRFEAIVVDDGPDDVTRAVAEGGVEGRRFAVRYLSTDGSIGPAAARNIGWRAAAAPVIAFTDDDTLPRRDWLLNGLRAMDGERAAVAGRVEVPLPFRPRDHHLDVGRLSHSEFVTANCFVWKSALEEVGGFDERFRMAWREDSDLQFSLLEHGLSVGRALDAQVVHPVRRESWGRSIAAQRKAFFNPLLRKKHPDLYDERIGRSPRWYYLAVLSLFVMAAGVLVRDQVIVLAAAVAWVSMTLGFALIRLHGTSRHPSHVMEMLVTSALIPIASLYWRIRGALRFRTVFW